MRLQTLSAWLLPIAAVAARADTLQTHEEYEPLPLEESIKEFGLEKYVDELPPLDELQKRDPNVRCRAAVCSTFHHNILLAPVANARSSAAPFASHSGPKSSSPIQTLSKPTKSVIGPSSNLQSTRPALSP